MALTLDMQCDQSTLAVFIRIMEIIAHQPTKCDCHCNSFNLDKKFVLLSLSIFMLTFRATGRGRIPMTEIDKCKPSGPKLYSDAL